MHFAIIQLHSCELYCNLFFCLLHRRNCSELQFNLCSQSILFFHLHFLVDEIFKIAWCSEDAKQGGFKGLRRQQLLFHCKKSSICHFKENDVFLTKPSKNMDVLKCTFSRDFFTFTSGDYGQILWNILLEKSQHISDKCANLHTHVQNCAVTQ